MSSNLAQIAAMNQQQPQQQQQSNPFDAGILRAIQSARMSLASKSPQQEQNNLIAGINAASAGLANATLPTRNRRGFWANFASMAPALTAGSSGYLAAEAQTAKENEAEADKVLKYYTDDLARQTAAEDQAWRRQYAEAQLEETKRSHNLLDRFRHDSLESKSKSGKRGKHGNDGEGSLDKVLDQAESLINNSDADAHRGRGKRILNKFIPGGELPLTEEQAEINAIGDVLRGQLFNKWGYRNQAEFEHVPSISADNPREVNLAILQQLKGLLSSSEQMPAQENINNGSVIMQDANGIQYEIPTNEADDALNDGLTPVE